MQGLPFHLQNKMFCQYELDPDDNVNMDFKNLLKKAMSLLVANKKLASLVQFEKKSQGVENLVEKCNHKTRISFTPNFWVALPSVPTHHSLNFPITTFIQTSGIDY